MSSSQEQVIISQFQAMIGKESKESQRSEFELEHNIKALDNSTTTTTIRMDSSLKRKSYDGQEERSEEDENYKKQKHEADSISVDSSAGDSTKNNSLTGVNASVDACVKNTEEEASIGNTTIKTMTTSPTISDAMSVLRNAIGTSTFYSYESVHSPSLYHYLGLYLSSFGLLLSFMYCLFLYLLTGSQVRDVADIKYTNNSQGHSELKEEEEEESTRHPYISPISSVDDSDKYLFLVHFANGFGAFRPKGPTLSGGTRVFLSALEEDYAHKVVSWLPQKIYGHETNSYSRSNDPIVLNGREKVHIFLIPAWGGARPEWPMLRVQYYHSTTFFGKQFLSGDVVRVLLSDNTFPGTIWSREQFQSHLAPTRDEYLYQLYLEYLERISSNTLPLSWLPESSFNSHRSLNNYDSHSYPNRYPSPVRSTFSRYPGSPSYSSKDLSSRCSTSYGYNSHDTVNSLRYSPTSPRYSPTSPQFSAMV